MEEKWDPGDLMRVVTIDIILSENVVKIHHFLKFPLVINEDYELMKDTHMLPYCCGAE